jgi:hypothetical protein
MNSRPTLKTENFDMDSFFDFNQGGTQPSPINPSTSRPDVTPQAASQDWSALSPFDQSEERQHFNGPSHDYNQYKQQVGLPLGSIHNLPMHPQMMDGFNSGIDMNMDGGFGNGWASGIDIDAEMGMDFNQPQQAVMPPPMFFPADGAPDNFVNPTSIGGQEEASNSAGRLWPGMHSQQAQQMAMQKAAQTQAMQQRQMRLQAQQLQYRQAANAAQSQSQASSAQQQSHGNGKRPSHATEPHVEESISRLLNQMRHNSSNSGDDAGSPDNLLPQIARMRKDEEEMDEDERLLASEEGKKLSSKERRQLRNKVSARAFRSRRKGMFCHFTTSCKLTNDLQNTSVNSKAKSLSRLRKPPTCAARTPVSCKRTSVTAACSRPCFATLLSHLSSTTSVPTRLPLTLASFSKRLLSLHLLLPSRLSSSLNNSSSSKRPCSLSLSQSKKMSSPNL